jgi:diadenosine tetraphosphate (Ap4A) HIT family hydrolase
MALSSGCYSCDVESALAAQPPREQVHLEERWRVAHSFSSALPGWLVVLPRRHVLALDELGPDEAGALGPLLADTSAALREVTGCVKTYVALFGEQEGFAHLHFHVVPRLPTFGPELRGPRVFALLARTEGEWVPEAEQDRLARDVGAAIARRRQ